MPEGRLYFFKAGPVYGYLCTSYNFYSRVSQDLYVPSCAPNLINGPSELARPSFSPERDFSLSRVASTRLPVRSQRKGPTGGRVERGRMGWVGDRTRSYFSATLRPCAPAAILEPLAVDRGADAALPSRSSRASSAGAGVYPVES